MGAGAVTAGSADAQGETLRVCGEQAHGGADSGNARQPQPQRRNADSGNVNVRQPQPQRC